MRAFYPGWYRELVTELPVVEDGMIALAAARASGSSCCPGRQRADATCGRGPPTERREGASPCVSFDARRPVPDRAPPGALMALPR